MFVFPKPFQDSVVFAGKAVAYLGVTLFRCSTLGLASGRAKNNGLGLEACQEQALQLIMKIRNLRL